MKYKLIILSILTLTIFLASCTTENAPQCTQDTDCVPAQCCHPTDAVNIQYAPDCDGMACTGDCAPNTLDCGQGEIKCVENRCTVVITPVTIFPRY